MSSINVRAVQGRIARESPKGQMIPHDRFVAVPATPYIMRLLHHHGDIELAPIEKPKVVKQPPPVPTEAPSEPAPTPKE